MIGMGEDEGRSAKGEVRRVPRAKCLMTILIPVFSGIFF